MPRCASLDRNLPLRTQHAPLVARTMVGSGVRHTGQWREDRDSVIECGDDEPWSSVHCWATARCKRAGREKPQRSSDGWCAGGILDPHPAWGSKIPELNPMDERCNRAGHAERLIRLRAQARRRRADLLRGRHGHRRPGRVRSNCDPLVHELREPVLRLLRPCRLLLRRSARLLSNGHLAGALRPARRSLHREQRRRERPPGALRAARYVAGCGILRGRGASTHPLRG